MKKASKKIISIILCLVLLMSVCSAAFVSFAENEKENFSAPDIQTLLTDGKALKEWLEDNFLDLEKADIALADNLDSIATSAAPLLTDLYYYMGYNEEDYPSDLESLELCFARALSSLSDKMFREPEPIETIDISLLYNFAYIGGTDYIESVNNSLPDELKFDTSKPVLSLNDEQKATLSDYYAKWKAGALNLTGFNLKDYLGEMTAEEFLKDVLLVFIADDNRLPSITKTALNFEMGNSEKFALADFGADILDNLKVAPVSAIIRQLSDPSMRELITKFVEVVNILTVNTGAYSYRLFTEGIFTDTDGSAIPGIVKDGDSYRYEGTTMVSEYLSTINAALDLFAGIDKELEESVIETIFEKRLDKLAALASAALDAAFATVASEQLKLRSDIDCANIEIRFADQKIEELGNAQGSGQDLENLNNQLSQLNTEIAQLQEQLEGVDNQIATKKADYQGYYDLVEQVEKGEVEPSEDYETAKQTISAVENELAPLYTQKENLTQSISQKVEQADIISAQIEAFEPTDYDEIAAWQEAKKYAQGVIDESTEKLATLPDSVAIENVYNTVKPLVAGFFTAFDGVYDAMLNQTPVKAAIRLVYNLSDFIDTVENIDWDLIAPVTDPIFESIDSYIDSFAGKYIGKNGGNNMLGMLSEITNLLFDQYGIYNFVQADYLDNFVKETVLADNSDIMVMAANSLSQIFGQIEPNYESIVSCLVPILSAFNFGVIMDNMDNLAGALTLASPSAFAYLAGLSGNGLDSDYLNKVNASLAANGYKGTPVTPIISLSAQAQSKLLSYVLMEQNGDSLEQIAEAGFNWKNFKSNANTLDIANALVKMALGDSAKLGEIAAVEGLGTALVNLLCDLLNDVQSKPVATILTKLSNPDNITPIVNFAFGLLGGDDSTYMSYDLYFNRHEYKDKDGNYAFYAAYVNNELTYTGPRALECYYPVILSAIDLFSGIYGDVQANDGDLLKTLLYDKLPQIKNLLLSAISFKDKAGNDKAGAIFYLLLGYEDYARAQNEALCYELLIGLNEVAIQSKMVQIETKDEQIEFLNSKLEEIKVLAEPLKLAKAIELGILPEGTETYSDEAVELAINNKINEYNRITEQLSADFDTYQAEIDRLTPIVEEKKAPFDEYDAWLYDFALGAFFSDLVTIFETEDYEDLLSNLATNYADDYNSYVGENAFDELLGDIRSEHDNFDPDVDYSDDFTNAFVENYLLYGGMAGDKDADLYNAYDQVNQELEAVKKQLADAQATYLLAIIERGNLENGSVARQIESAGNGATINISFEPLDLNGAFNETQVKEIIATINSEDVQSLTNAIAQLQAEIDEYTVSKQASEKKASGFNFALIPIAAQAADAISQGVVDLLAGKAADGSENVYNYIMNKDIVGIITSPGRLQAIFEIIVGVYGPALNALVAEGMLSEETAAQLIAATPSFEGFYSGALTAFPNEFRTDPVPATAALINALCTTIATGFDNLDEKNSDTKQFEMINADIADIFSKTSGSEWNDSYSKSVITRTGEIYQLIVDLLGLSFIRDLVNDDPTHTHSYTDDVKEPTCTKRGYTVHTCECGDVVIDSYVPALGHNPVTDEAVAPTCTQTGLTEGSHCSRCNAVLTAQETVEALGHDFSDNAEFCRRGCGTANPDYVPPHVHDYKAVVTAPTCTEQGYTTYTCECGDSYKGDYVPALGHDFSDNAEFCRRGCGTANPGYVPPHVHDYKAVVTAPTCTEQGYTTYTCECGDSYKGDYVPALGHNMTFHDGAQETCTTAGNKPYYECERCHNFYIDDKGENFIEDKSEVIIPALGHDYKVTVTKSTATKLGYTTHTCANCGSKFVDTYKAPTGKPAGFKCASRTATAEKFTWTKTAGVTGYQIQLLNSAGKNAGLKALTTNSYTFSKLAAGHAYKARVRFYIKAADGKNYYGAWSTITSPTLPAGSAITKLTPAKKAFTAQWKKASVTGYQLQYATNAKFSKATAKTVKGAAKVKLAVKSLKGGAKYFVRVRTYKTIGGKNYYSAWSGAKAVTTKK